MKQLLTLVLSVVISSAQAQFLLNIDGESPNPFSDKSGYNAVTFAGIPLINNGAIEFPSGSDYLKINSFIDFELNSDWTVSFDIQVDSITDSVYVLDWRSEPGFGHLGIAYNPNRGVYFSDKNINGLYGNIVADTIALPASTWVHFDVKNEGDSIFIDRDGVQVASSYFVGVLSPVERTTIGYSTDFSVDHASFRLDNLTLTGVFNTSSIAERGPFQFEFYPNPVQEFLTISTNETIQNLNIYNVLGKLEISTGFTTNQINVGELESGVYFLELQSENGVAVRRFLKI